MKGASQSDRAVVNEACKQSSPQAASIPCAAFPKKGGIYTMSRSAVAGDRSWVGYFWEVLGVNYPVALIRDPEAQRCNGYRFGKKPMLVEIDDFGWTEAGDLYAIATEAGTDETPKSGSAEGEGHE